MIERYDEARSCRQGGDGSHVVPGCPYEVFNVPRNNVLARARPDSSDGAALRADRVAGSDAPGRAQASTITSKPP